MAGSLRGEVTHTREVAGTEIMIDPPFCHNSQAAKVWGWSDHHDPDVQSHEEAPHSKRAHRGKQREIGNSQNEGVPPP